MTRKHLCLIGAVSVFLPSLAQAQQYQALVFHGGDDRLFTSDGDWFYGFWKGECGTDQSGNNLTIIAGASNYINLSNWPNPAVWYSQAMLCASSNIQVNQASGDTLTAAWGGDDRDDTSTGDWAPNYVKLECAQTSVMTGFSQTATNWDNGGQEGAKCSASNIHAATSCSTVWSENNVSGGGFDNRESPTFGADWSPNYPKMQCASGRYVKGVAIEPLSYTEAYWLVAILCCTPSF
jgi:hypothetical protein